MPPPGGWTPPTPAPPPGPAPGGWTPPGSAPVPGPSDPIDPWAPNPTGPRSDGPDPEERISKGGGPWPLVGMVAALVVVIALIWLVGVRPSPGPDADEVADPPGADSGTGSSGATDPGDGSGDDADLLPDDGSDLFAIPFRPDSVAVLDDAVWVSDSGCGLVVKVDRATTEVVGAVDLGGAASGVTAADGSIWVGNRDRQRVVRLDPTGLTTEATVNLPGYALSLANGVGQVWATDPLAGAVYRIEPDGSAAPVTEPVGSVAHHVVVSGGVAWVTNNGDATVTRIETTEGGEVTTLPVGVGPLHVTTGVGSAWVTNNIDATVTRLDEVTGDRLADIDVGFAPHALAFVAGSIWVGSDGAGLWRIDPATDTAEAVAGAGDFSSIDMAVDGEDIWIADTAGGTLVQFNATTGQVVNRIDLNEDRDCETLRSEAVRPPAVETV